MSTKEVTKPKNYSRTDISESDDDSSVESIYLVDKRSDNSSSKMKNSLNIDEIEHSDIQCLKSLSRYRNTLAPFISPTTLKLLTTSTIGRTVTDNQLDEPSKIGNNKGRNGSNRRSSSVVPSSSSSSTTLNEEDSFVTVQQPPSLTGCTMRTYQLEGLTWLANNYNQSINCILADEMGLGRCCQLIKCGLCY